MPINKATSQSFSPGGVKKSAIKPLFSVHCGLEIASGMNFVFVLDGWKIVLVSALSVLADRS